MKEFKFLTSSTYNRTKSWITGIYSFIFIFVYFLIIWILFGEFNVLHFNFVVFANRYEHFDQSLNQMVTNPAQVSNWIFLFLFIPGIFYLVTIFLIHYFFKQTAWDMIPIVFSLWFGFIALILSGAFANAWSIWIIIARIILVATVFFFSFFALNALINLLIGKSSFAADFFSNALNQELVKKENLNVMKNLNGKNQKEEIIDVLAEHIFLKTKKMK